MSARLVATGLDWNAAKARLMAEYGVTAGAAFRALTGAHDQGSFQTPTWRVRRISVSPERFEIHEHDWRTGR